ncbi:DUF4129 domain-containing protein [Leifsonia sp. NPDC058194]|uniref:DUF4129 domain-containing protein n=1 Tax=Leifsonia sp. NPDC058194 TaxID=3346374 RepID=UPI0036DF02F9
MRFDIPVDPTGPQGQEWIRGELAKPEYQAAKPTWFDIASKAVQDWIDSLLRGPTGDAWPVLLLVVVLVIVALIVVAFVIFGRPRVNRRSALDRRPVFGADDARSADELRRSAQAAANGGDWVLAIEEQFRAIAVGLDERTLVTVTPGTTATHFAAAAAEVLPNERHSLTDASRAFDAVRYLDRPGTAAAYQQLVALDQRLLEARPTLPVAVP